MFHCTELGKVNTVDIIPDLQQLRKQRIQLGGNGGNIEMKTMQNSIKRQEMTM